ncbi:MAG: VanW family protein [Microgenomates group bacterium]
MPLSTHSFSLEKRYGNDFVNDVFKDNILLTLHYMAGTVKGKGDIVWENIEKPFHYEFTLKPGETFAYHDQVLPEYNKSLAKTTNAHFNYSDGFKSDGYLMGDGVCHFASLIYWAAKDAGLDAVSPVDHNFAVIPEVPKEYGVSIYFMPGNPGNSSRQNLYITNNLDKPVTFVFDYNGVELKVDVVKSLLGEVASAL